MSKKTPQQLQDELMQAHQNWHEQLNTCVANGPRLVEATKAGLPLAVIAVLKDAEKAYRDLADRTKEYREAFERTLGAR